MPLRPTTLAAFALGALTGAAALAAATDAPPAAARARPSVPPAKAVATAQVLEFKDAEWRRHPKMHGNVRVLAHGQAAWLGKLDLAPGASVPEHADATEEFLHVTAGRGKVTIDGRTFEVRAGATIYMPAGAKVSFQNGDEPLMALQVFAGPAPAAKYADWKLVNP